MKNLQDVLAAAQPLTVSMVRLQAVLDLLEAQRALGHAEAVRAVEGVLVLLLTPSKETNDAK